MYDEEVTTRNSLLCLFLTTLSLGAMGCRSPTFENFLESTRASQMTENAESQVAELAQRHHRATRRIEEYQGEVDLLEARQGDLEKELRAARKKSTDATQAIAKLKAEEAAAVKAREEMAKKLAALKTQNATLAATVAKSATEVDGLEKEAAAQAISLTALKRRIDDATRELELLGPEDDRLRQALAGLLIRVNALKEANLPQAEVRIAALEAELKRLRKP